MTMNHTDDNKSKNSNKSWCLPNSFYDNRDSDIFFYILPTKASSLLLQCLLSIWHQPFVPSVILSFCYISHPLPFLFLNHFSDTSYFRLFYNLRCPLSVSLHYSEHFSFHWSLFLYLVCFQAILLISVSHRTGINTFCVLSISAMWCLLYLYFYEAPSSQSVDVVKLVSWFYFDISKCIPALLRVAHYFYFIIKRPLPLFHIHII